MEVKHRNPLAEIKKCPGCVLQNKVRQQVIGRGSLPADLLLIGEGPGKSEDLLGEPFIGPSGKLLDQTLLDASILAMVPIPSHYITNVVLCRPWIYQEEDELYGENREPVREEILACMPNIMKIASVVRPKHVIFVGKVSEKYYRKEFRYSTRIYHPAFHLRYGGITSPFYRGDVRTLSEIFGRLHVD